MKCEVYLSEHRVQRGRAARLLSAKQLETAIMEVISRHHQHPEAFVWTAKAKVDWRFTTDDARIKLKKLPLSIEQ